MNQAIELHLDEANLTQLQTIAKEEGLTAEELAERTVVHFVKMYSRRRAEHREQKRGQSFQQAMQEVLTENEELFRRLAQ